MDCEQAFHSFVCPQVKGVVVASKRPLPVARTSTNVQFFKEPAIPKPNCCTISSIVEILFNFQENEQGAVDKLAEKYNLEKKSVGSYTKLFSITLKKTKVFI